MAAAAEKPRMVQKGSRHIFRLMENQKKKRSKQAVLYEYVCYPFKYKEVLIENENG